MLVQRAGWLGGTKQPPCQSCTPVLTQPPARGYGAGMSDKSKFVVGDVVRRRGDGPNMTVESNADRGAVGVAWFVSAQLHRETVNAETLELASEAATT